MYDELVEALRYCATHPCMGEGQAIAHCKAVWAEDDKFDDCDSCNAVLKMQAADAIEELMAFARFVAEEVVVDDNEWGNNQNAFPEIACRKLFNLGIVSKIDDEMWHYEPPKGE